VEIDLVDIGPEKKDKGKKVVIFYAYSARNTKKLERHLEDWAKRRG